MTSGTRPKPTLPVPRVLFGIWLLVGTANLAAGAQDVSPSTPVFAEEIRAGLFGLHFFRSTIPWPTVPFSSYRLWDTGAEWASINTAEGKYDWTHLDLLLDLARAHNVDLLYTFGHTPQWASLRPNEPCINPPGRGCAAPPRDMRYWDNFVRAIATHNKKHGGRIKYWEIWNEWDVPEYWTGDTATMVTMAQHAYRIIKSIDPKALVLTPNASREDDVYIGPIVWSKEVFELKDMDGDGFLSEKDLWDHVAWMKIPAVNAKIFYHRSSDYAFACVMPHGERGNRGLKTLGKPS